MGKAVGIGGVFLHFEGEEAKVMKWYEENLGFEMTEYGTGFSSGEQLVLLSFKRGKSKNPYLNLRVDDIEEIINRFVLKGINITKEVTEYPYGKFATFEDPFGNLIELWEPYIEEYLRMVKEEIESYKKKDE